MARYIDADEVKKAIEESWDGCLGSYDSHEITMNDLWVIDRVQTADVVELEGSKVYKCLSYTTTGMPTADFVPVVRCKDCLHYENGFCYNPNTYDDEKTRGNTTPNWFCADGERREEPTMEEYMYGQEGSEEDGSL